MKTSNSSNSDSSNSAGAGGSARFLSQGCQTEKLLKSGNPASSGGGGGPLRHTASAREFRYIKNISVNQKRAFALFNSVFSYFKKILFSSHFIKSTY